MREITSANNQVIRRISNILNEKESPMIMREIEVRNNRRRFFTREKESMMKSLLTRISKLIREISRRRYRLYNRIARPVYRIAHEISHRAYNNQLKYRAQGFRGISNSLTFTLHVISEYDETIGLSPLYIRLLAGLYAREIRFIILDSCEEYFSRVAEIDRVKKGN